MFDNRETIDRLPVADAMVVRNADWSIVDLSPGARVARGMLYIQRTYPNALSIVDIDTLDISDGMHCVLGQLHGQYSDAPEIFRTEADWRQAHGFLLLADDEFEEGTTDWHLNVLWRIAFEAWASAE